MRGAIVDDRRSALFCDVARANDVEAAVTQIQCCLPRETLCLRRVENFDFYPRPFGCPCVIGSVALARRRPEPPQLPGYPADPAHNQKCHDDSAVAAARAVHRRLFQSSTVPGKM